MRLKTVIADDDTLAVRSLMRLLSKFEGEIEVISIARNGKEGLEMIERLRPELTFVDVAMPILDGFEIARRLTHKPVMVFMTTAGTERHEAEAAGAIALLFKPIGRDDIEALMNQVRAALKLPAVLQFRPRQD